MQNYRFTGNIGTTEVVKNLLILNGLFFILRYALISIGVNPDLHLLLYYFDSPLFKPYQVLTHMFSHYAIWHIAVNMISLISVGPTLERMLKPKRFLILYFLSGIGAVLLSQLMIFFGISPNSMGGSLGASGAICGLITAFARWNPNQLFFLMFIPIPIRAISLSYFLIIFSALAGFLGVLSGIGHFAHLGGALTGLLIAEYWNRTNRSSLY